MLPFRADLHCHTHYSDGSSLPSELIDLAVAANLQGLSITDHDTLAAYPQALPLAQQKGIQLLSGIELSAFYETTTVHILGYGFDLTNALLNQTCQAIAKARNEANLIVLEKLKRHRFIISPTELEAAFPNRTIGRPHIAKLMVQKGYVPTIKAAFSEYLGDKARCARGPIKVLGVSEAIHLIHQAKGFAILAHPHHFKNKKLIHKLLAQEAAFDGLETYYGLMPLHLERPIMEIAQKHSMIMTGGSDFHGTMRPHLRLGCSFTPQFTFEMLYHRHHENNPIRP